VADYLEKLKSEYPGVFGPVAASDYTTLAGMGDSVDYILDYWKDRGEEGVKFLKDFAFEHMTSPEVKGYIERSKERGEDLEKKRDDFSDALKGYMDRSEKDALEKAKEHRDKLKISGVAPFSPDALGYKIPFTGSDKKAHDKAVSEGRKPPHTSAYADYELDRALEKAGVTMKEFKEALAATGHSMSPEEFAGDHLYKGLAYTPGAGLPAIEVPRTPLTDPTTVPVGSSVAEWVKDALELARSGVYAVKGRDADSALIDKVKSHLEFPDSGISALGPKDPYPGMIDPTFEPTATTHYDDVLKHFETEAVPGHLPMDITDIPPYSAIMGEPYKYDPVMPSSSDYSRPDMELDPATRALIDYDMDAARATLGDPGYVDPYPGVDDFSSMPLGTGLDEATKAKIDADMASGMFTEVAGKGWKGGPIPGKIYDARDFITDFGPLTASTHGEEPWRGLTTADFATDAEFRPGSTAAKASGLARLGLGAGSLGAGLMTHSEPLGVGSDIPGRIPAAHHGPVWPVTTEMPIDATGAPIEVDDFSELAIPSPAFGLPSTGDELTEEDIRILKALEKSVTPKGGFALEEYFDPSYTGYRPSWMGKDISGMWHDTRGFAHTPGYDWRTGRYTDGGSVGSPAKREPTTAEKVAEAAARMASIPAGFIGGPPKTMTYIDATGGPTAKFGGVGDIGGGSGTVTAPLTAGGFYVPITPHIPITAPAYVDPFPGMVDPTWSG